VLEEADAVAQQDGHQVDGDLVEQASLETLVSTPARCLSCAGTRP
jgi:hypothetical protein